MSAPDCKLHPLLSPVECCSARAPDVYDVTFATTRGPFRAHVVRADAPLGADRFNNLVTRHFFDSDTEHDNNAGFFRVVPGFVVQWGIPGNTSVSAAWVNAVIANDPVILSNVRGTIAYAAEQDASGVACNRTTQIYVNCEQRKHKDSERVCAATHQPPFPRPAVANNSRLDALGFTPFATIDEVDMAAVVDRLYAGYGQTPDQGLITSEGDAYLRASFPKLDYVTGTTTKPKA